jgi:L-lactate permease
LLPVLLVAGLSFGLSQFLASNFIDYTLADVLSSLGSLLATVTFLKFWQPAVDPHFSLREAQAARATSSSSAPPWQGWLPWIIVSATVVIWSSLKIAAIGQMNISWPGLHKAISITLYHDKPYAAIWQFQPLGTGTAILLAAVLTAAVVRLSAREFLACVLGVHARSGSRFERSAVHTFLALPRLGGRAALGQRHVGQCPVRQPASGRRPAARFESGIVRGDQFIRRRHG